MDLYVLERAFASTHPVSEPLFAAVIDAYGRELGTKAWENVWRRLEEGSVVHFVPRPTDRTEAPSAPAWEEAQHGGLRLSARRTRAPISTEGGDSSWLVDMTKRKGL